FFDVEEERYRLAHVQVLDLGDVDILYLDVEETFSRIAETVRGIVARGALPLILGGDHSITFPAVRGLLSAGTLPELFIVQLDAHLDFRDQLLGVRLANSSPIRRISELEGVKGGVNFGVRGWRTSEDDYRQAVARGFQPVLAKEIHRQERQGELEHLIALVPPGLPVYVTLDIDGLDPSLAPGTGSPEPEGLTYTQAKALLRALGRRNPIVGIDLVEVNPYFDPTERTQLVGVALLLEALSAARDGI
ncbi:MAG: arginase family protein, partial [Bacillota bacterium]|nr:arginase family protein [Bacillota bacterium]